MDINSVKKFILWNGTWFDTNLYYMHNNNDNIHKLTKNSRINLYIIAFIILQEYKKIK